MLVRATLLLRNENMLRARKKLGLSQIALAQVAGVRTELVSAVESLNFSKVSEQKIVRIAEALDLRPEDIVPPEVVGKVLPTKFVSIRDVDPSRLSIESSRPVYALEMKQSLSSIRKAVEGICRPREARFLLCKISGMSFSDIAKENGSIVSETVRFVCFKAIAKIKLHATNRLLSFHEESIEVMSVLKAIGLVGGMEFPDRVLKAKYYVDYARETSGNENQPQKRSGDPLPENLFTEEETT